MQLELRQRTKAYGPGGEHEHGADEHAKVKELVASAKIYAELMMTFSG